jgi:hypothetical protein
LQLCGDSGIAVAEMRLRKKAKDLSRAQMAIGKYERVKRRTGWKK